MGFVGDLFFVYVFVDVWEDMQNCWVVIVDVNVGVNCVYYVDGFGFFQFLWMCVECVWFGGQCVNGVQIDDIVGQFVFDCVFQIGCDFSIFIVIDYVDFW